MPIRPALALALSLLCQASVSGQSTAPAQRYAYLIDLGGEVVKLDLATGKPVYSSVIPDSIMGSDSLIRWRYGPTLEAAALDSSAAGLVVSLPDSALGDDDQRLRSYRVLYLSLPDFRLLGRFDIPLPQTGGVELLMDRYRGRVLVRWENTEHPDTTGWTYHVSALSLPDLKEVRRWVSRLDRSPTGPPGASFTHLSNQTIGSTMWVGPDSTVFRHSRGDVVFQGDSFAGRWEPFIPRTTERVGAVARSLGVDSSQRILFGWPLDIQNGVLLRTSTADSGQRIQLLEIGPAGATQVTSRWVTPWGKANLLAAGRTVVVQPIDGPMNGGTTQLSMPGVLIYYDAGSGRETGRMTVPSLAGRFQLTDGLCSTSDERYLILRHPDGGIQIIEPATLRSRSVTLKNPVSIAAACFTSAK